MIQDDFLLSTKLSEDLFHGFAESMPIFDYHCHLPPAEIAEDRVFNNLTEIWLDGDHYKWRAMRAAGVAEHLVTGDADPYDRFLAWVEVLPRTLGNPLFFWSHLELDRVFGIRLPITQTNALAIWEEANSLIKDLPVSSILRNFKVAMIGTTDDPADGLQHHEALVGGDVAVVPSFRPDSAFAVDRPDFWQAWVAKLAERCGAHIDRLDDLLGCLHQRHLAFHQVGGRICDHGLSSAPTVFFTIQEAQAVFDKVLAGETATAQEKEGFIGFLLERFCQWDREKAWVKQLHLGPLRNVNRKAWENLGPDTGFDTVGDTPQVESLARFLDHMDRQRILPKTIVYNSNPRDNESLSALVGAFPEEEVWGKVQFGAAWWFNDHPRGIESQLQSLATNSLLGQSLGMLTDSRSFLSFPRHEVFRRVLCDFLGKEVAKGVLPNDLEFLGSVVQDICFRNAVRYFGVSVPSYEKKA